MEWVLGTIIVLQGLVNVYLTRLVLQTQSKDSQSFSVYLLNMFESAMAHVRAKSLEEKVATDAAKSRHDAQLAYLKDTLAKQEAIAFEKQKSQEPTYVAGEDGKRYKRDEIEII